jgi:hypothetical protein
MFMEIKYEQQLINKIAKYLDGYFFERVCAIAGDTTPKSITITDFVPLKNINPWRKKLYSWKIGSQSQKVKKKLGDRFIGFAHSHLDEDDELPSTTDIGLVGNNINFIFNVVSKTFVCYDKTGVLHKGMISPSK